MHFAPGQMLLTLNIAAHYCRRYIHLARNAVGTALWSVRRYAMLVDSGSLMMTDNDREEECMIRRERVEEAHKDDQ